MAEEEKKKDNKSWLLLLLLLFVAGKPLVELLKSLGAGLGAGLGAVDVMGPPERVRKSPTAPSAPAPAFAPAPERAPARDAQVMAERLAEAEFILATQRGAAHRAAPEVVPPPSFWAAAGGIPVPEWALGEAEFVLATQRGAAQPAEVPDMLTESALAEAAFLQEALMDGLPATSALSATPTVEWMPSVMAGRPFFRTQEFVIGAKIGVAAAIGLSALSALGPFGLAAAAATRAAAATGAAGGFGGLGGFGQPRRDLAPGGGERL